MKGILELNSVVSSGMLEPGPVWESEAVGGQGQSSLEAEASLGYRFGPMDLATSAGLASPSPASFSGNN